MSRSPLFYPLNRGMDAEAGGAAELQTDVMRFMAIISLCLVAIFALVQTIPLEPQVVKPVKQVAANSPAAERIPKPEPMPEPIPEPAPAPEPRAKQAQQAPKVQQAVTPPLAAPPADPKIGFTLRFASDVALMRLVSSDAVALYAVASDQSVKMQVKNGRIGFQASATPQQMHEMDVRTVPDSVINAMRRTANIPPAAVTWGVVLPARMSAELDRILQQHSGGNLVIRDDGTLRLES
jgi:hypothetical protein